MRLYHYLDARWALDDIRRRRLKVSTISDMNDPYELRCVASDHSLTTLALEKTANEVARRYGALCFSRSWNNVLMWSHYGDRHKGICLGFDIPEENTRPVEYALDVLTVGDLIVENEADFQVDQGLEIVNRLLGLKYRGWEFEDEVRMHVGRNEPDEETGLYFRDFSARLVLREVIAGPMFPHSKKLIDDALEGYLGRADVKVVKARCSVAKFEVVIDENWQQLKALQAVQK